MHNQYKPIDKSLKIYDKVQQICKKHLTEESTLENFLDLYNTKIRKELKTERADSIKSALSILWLLGFKKLAKEITTQLNNNPVPTRGTQPKQRTKIQSKEIEEHLLDEELENSMQKAIQYATKNSNVTKKKNTKAVVTTVAGVTALAMIKRFTHRTKTVMNVRGVEIISRQQLTRAKKFGYEEFTFYAELDSRTTPGCKELHGKTFKIEDGKVGVNIPPLHFHCRSHIIYHN